MAIYIFLSIFILLSGLSTLLKWSLTRSRYSFLKQGAFFMLLGFGFYSYSIDLTQSVWLQALKHPNSVSYVAIIQFIESFALILMSFRFIRDRVGASQHKWIQIFEWIPSLLFVLGFLFTQLLVFMMIHGMDYLSLNAGYILFVWLSMYGAQWLVKKVLPEWELRTELLVILAFIQILIAMFLPLIVQDVQSPGLQFTDNWFALGISLGSLFFLIVAGGLFTYFYPNFRFKHLLNRL
jgi:heme/copper-type cytochrome/quinol oxidase subunit 4